MSDRRSMGHFLPSLDNNSTITLNTLSTCDHMEWIERKLVFKEGNGKCKRLSPSTYVRLLFLHLQPFHQVLANCKEAFPYLLLTN